jgi:hypothetical protein
MLKNLREASNRPFAKFLMFILMFSFVGWGVAGWVFGESSHDDSIVRIGREPISLTQFNRERDRQMAHLPREQQRQIFIDRAAGVHFSQQILSGLASQSMLDQRAADMGLAVSNSGVAAAIRAEPAFQENGVFSPAQFEWMVSTSGLSEAAFAEHIRRTILRDMVTSGLSASLPVPDFVITAMYNARNTQRKIEFATVLFSDFAVTDAPTPDQLRQTHSRNPRPIPEYRTISVITVPADMSKPDSIDAAFATAQRLEDAIIGGEPMQSAAAAHNAKFTSIPAVNADWTTRAGRPFNDPAIGDEIRRQAFRLEQGIESEILETKSGFSIVRVEKVYPAHIAEFDAVRDEMVALWQTEQRKRQAYERANSILIAANRDKTPVGRTVTVTRTGGAPLEVLNAAFQTPVGVNTIVPGADRFHVLSVKESITPEMTATQKAALKAEAETTMSRTLRDDYSAFLSRRYPMKINNRMFRRLFDEGR